MSPKIQLSQSAVGGGKKGKGPDIENAERSDKGVHVEGTGHIQSPTAHSHWRQDIKAEWCLLFSLMLAVIVMGIISDTELNLSSCSLVGCNLALCLKCCKELRHTWEKGREEILPLRGKPGAPKPALAVQTSSSFLQIQQSLAWGFLW